MPSETFCDLLRKLKPLQPDGWRSDTPRTDARAFGIVGPRIGRPAMVVPAEFAESLERESAQKENLMHAAAADLYSANATIRALRRQVDRLTRLAIEATCD